MTNGISVSFFVPFETMSQEQRQLVMAKALDKFTGRALTPELVVEIEASVKEVWAQFLTPVISVRPK